MEKKREEEDDVIIMRLLPLQKEDDAHTHNWSAYIVLPTSSILSPTFKNPPKGRSEELDMTRIRTASKGQVSREVMMVAKAEAPKMMGISKTSDEPGPTLLFPNDWEGKSWIIILAPRRRRGT